TAVAVHSLSGVPSAALHARRSGHPAAVTTSTAVVSWRRGAHASRARRAGLRVFRCRALSFPAICSGISSASPEEFLTKFHRRLSPRRYDHRVHRGFDVLLEGDDRTEHTQTAPVVPRSTGLIRHGVRSS